MDFEKFKGVVFDFDGVFADSIPMHDRAYQQVLSDIGVSVTVEYLHKAIGSTPRQVLTSILQDTHPDKIEQTLKAFISYLGERCTQLPVSRNMDTLLEVLKGKKYSIGVASSTDSFVLRSFLETNRLLPFVDFIVGGENLQKGKPDPEMIQKCLSGLQLSPSGAFAVDDARSGILAAKSLGMYAIAYAKHSKKEIPEADLTITDFSELLN